MLRTIYLTTSQTNNRSEIQNSNKIYKMFNNISNVVPWNEQANELNFETVILWQLSQVSWSSNAFFEEIS